MELILHAIGYAIIIGALAGIIYVFIRLLSAGLDTLSKHDD